MFEGFSEERIALDSGVTIRARIGGEGPPLLLLHGYPQTSACWHKVAPRLVEAGFRVVASDLRGYGGSDKPASGADHATYSKRATAADQIELMAALGHERFCLAGHDRGGRVGHRLALDHPQVVEKLAVLDIAPTAAMYGMTDKAFATGYYHWFFLIQPAPFPERLIGADPGYYLRHKLGGLSKGNLDAFTEDALAEYLEAFRDPACISATCEDYRAAASIDLEHDEADGGRKVAAPLLALWGKKGLVHRTYDVLGLWRQRAENVSGRALDCGHFLPEEAPEETAEALIDFFSGRPA